MRSKWYLIGGAIFVGWAATNTLVVIQRYGADWGSYFWFCNLCLFGTGVGLLLKNRGLLTGFVAIAFFTQAFWLIDNIARRITGQGLFGLIDFRYESGYPVDEFVLASYHYFTIPVALLALFHLPQRKNNTLKLVSIFNPLIFGISYFAFSAGQNVNCIHEACFSGLKQWRGPLYAVLFWALVFGVHLVLAHELNRFLLNLRIGKRTKRQARAAFAALCLMGVALCASDVREKLSIPRFTCLEPQTIDEVTSGCQYTKNYYDDRLLLGYYVENKKAQDQLCSVTLRDGTRSTILNESMTASAHEKVIFSTPIPRPKSHAAVRVLTKCRPFISSASTN